MEFKCSLELLRSNLMRHGDPLRCMHFGVGRQGFSMIGGSTVWALSIGRDEATRLKYMLPSLNRPATYILETGDELGYGPEFYVGASSAVANRLRDWMTNSAGADYQRVTIFTSAKTSAFGLGPAFFVEAHLIDRFIGDGFLRNERRHIPPALCKKDRRIGEAYLRAATSFIEHESLSYTTC